MTLVMSRSGMLSPYSTMELPELVVRSGENAEQAFLEYLAGTIANASTRAAYGRAIVRFLDWCADRGIGSMATISPLAVAAYFRELQQQLATPSQKLHLAAVRALFDHCVIRQVIPTNPAASIRAPRHVVKRGKTPVLTAGETRHLLDSIDASKLSGLRDRALIAVMVFSFTRISAVLRMNVEDFFVEGHRRKFRLSEKGGKQHVVPAHHTAEEYMHAYLDAAGLRDQLRGPLFGSLDRHGNLSLERLSRFDALRMVKRRTKAAGLPNTIGNHSFRATGITTFLQNGGSLESAQLIAAHESPRTTKLYDRTSDEVTLDEIERIRI